MIEAIQVIWFLCLLVISVFHLIVFRLKNNHQPFSAIPVLPGVSVIIAVRNSTEQLKEHLYGIIHQDYPSFEVIIVDDHSDPVERKNLEEFVSFWPQVKFLTSSVAGKKHALLTGIEKAKYDFILCTDADCKPASQDWIRTMIEQGFGRDAVIGYSPYQKSPGCLNLLIRFETVMTGIQYLSWAMKGKPYMGVGRNILYPRSLFMASKPFSQHQDVPYGDDDLGIQALSGKSVIKVCMDERAHMISMPAKTWSQWLKQKHRHLSAGHYYKPELWWQPGLYGLALIGHWFLLSLMFDSLTWWKWIPVFAVGLLIRWLNYFRWTHKLGDKDTVRWYPLLEIIYAVYLAVMGSLTTLVKKKTWN